MLRVVFEAPDKTIHASRLKSVMGTIVGIRNDANEIYVLEYFDNGCIGLVSVNGVAELAKLLREIGKERK